MLKLDKLRLLIINFLKNKFIFFFLFFFVWSYWLLAYNNSSFLNFFLKKMYNLIKNKLIKKKIKKIKKLLTHFKIKFTKIFNFNKGAKKKFVKKQKPFWKKYFVKFKIKPNKKRNFKFKYLWKKIWSTSSFFSSAYSYLRSAWLYFKSTRSNFFASFYYTGAIYMFTTPKNVEYLNTSFNNPYKVKILIKETFKLPFKLHPYVRHSKSPYSYVAASCSSGSVGFKKKEKRSGGVFAKMQKFFNIFFMYYFSFYKIDFLFFRLNGVYRFLKFFKKKFFKQIRHNFRELKNTYRKILRLKKWLNAYDKGKNVVSHLLSTLSSIAKKTSMKPKIQVSKEFRALIDKHMKPAPDKKELDGRKRLRKMVMRMLYIVSQFPKFVYILDTTTYPFNGCRRVRHYKK